MSLYATTVLNGHCQMLQIQFQVEQDNYSKYEQYFQKTDD